MLQEKPSGSGERENYGEGINKSDTCGTEQTFAIKIEKIGDLTPIQDFEAMIARRDSPEWVDKAIMEMKKKITDLLQQTHKEEIFPKAVEYIIALRKACIVEQV